MDRPRSGDGELGTVGVDRGRDEEQAEVEQEIRDLLGRHQLATLEVYEPGIHHRDGLVDDVDPGAFSHAFTIASGGVAHPSGGYVDPRHVPLALQRLHRLGDTATELNLRLVWPVTAYPLADLLHGAGFEPVGNPAAGGLMTLRRLPTLADTVGPGMRVLVCGLNPSVHAAAAGLGFVTPSNRFWPAAIAAGLLMVPRDPLSALIRNGVGMTDLVKRATPRAAEVRIREYRAGMARLERLVAWLQPATLCFIGLAGYRAVKDRGARPGWQDEPIGGRPTYVMPSTSGLNASTSLAALAAHLAAAAGGRGS